MEGRFYKFRNGKSKAKASLPGEGPETLSQTTINVSQVQPHLEVRGRPANLQADGGSLLASQPWPRGGGTAGHTPTPTGTVGAEHGRALVKFRHHKTGGTWEGGKVKRLIRIVQPLFPSVDPNASPTFRGGETKAQNRNRPWPRTPSWPVTEPGLESRCPKPQAGLYPSRPRQARERGCEPVRFRHGAAGSHGRGEIFTHSAPGGVSWALRSSPEPI